MIDKYEDKITIAITNTCNIDCIYCYSNKEAHNKQVIPLEFVKLGIKDFFSMQESRKIKFFGSGEPTTEIKLLKEIVEYATSISDKKLELEIQTNGIFPESTASWLAENFTTIYISSDGTPDIQNYYRPYQNGKPTSNTLEKNLNYFKKYAKGKVAIRITIGKLNVEKQKEIVDYFNTFNIKYIWTRPIFPAPIGDKNIESELVEMDLYLNEYVEAKEYAEKLGLSHIFRDNLKPNK